MALSEINNYHYGVINLKGAAKFPLWSDVLLDLRQQTATALQLDANVCLDLIQLVTNPGGMNSANKIRAQHLLVTADHSKTDIIPGFGLLELCSNRFSLKVDHERYEDYGLKLWSAIHLDINKFNDDEYCASFRKVPEELKPIEFPDEIKNLLRAFYIAFLRIIVQTKKNGLSAANAFDQLREYVDWMENRLDIILAIPLKTAHAIFGGNSRARKMLKLDQQDMIWKNVAWGAAWDAFQFAMSQHFSTIKSSRLGEILRHKSYFITADRALFEILAELELIATVDGGENFSRSFVSDNSNPPHFNKKQAQIDDLYRSLTFRRAIKVQNKLPDFLQLVTELESQLG